jgi:thioredoxin-related protein
MKKYILFFYALVFAQVGFAQGDSIQAPYLRFPNFPPVKLLMPDSTSYFTKDKLPKKSPVMLMLFNPQCDHCQHETEEIVRSISQFKNIQIVMATSMPLSSMNEFREKYKLAAYENIIVAQDIHYFLPSYFMIRNLPFLAFYNKKKELISVFQGSMPIEKVLEELKK